MKTLDSVDLAHKRVLIREDLNVPLGKDGRITDDTRIRAAIPTIKKALDAGALVTLMSHLGRPSEGAYDAALSLAPVGVRLSTLLGVPVVLEKDWIDGFEQAPGTVVLCENVRFLIGEKTNDAALSKKMGALCDVFVMDAFATAHRAQASTVGVISYAPLSVAGPLLMREQKALMPLTQSPEKPVVAVVGGSKVSTKIALLESLVDKVDTLIVGGGIANTFLAAKGFAVEASLYEADWLERARALMRDAEQKGVAIPMPVDVVVADAFNEKANVRTVPISDVHAGEMILDVGPVTAASYESIMAAAKTIIWNGPVGVFEMAVFSHGTESLARAIAASPAYSVAGGGDTLAAISKYKIANDLSYISTGGGAFLELMQGDSLPAIVALEHAATTPSQELSHD
jgi:phosphoglycerate kinase